MSKLILGTWGLSGKSFVGDRASGYGDVSINDAFDVFDAACEHGIDHVDTAPNYGNFNGYRRIHQWQEDRGAQFSLIVKVGRFEREGVMHSHGSINEILQQAAPILEMFPNVSHLLIKDPAASLVENGQLVEFMKALNMEHPSLTIGFSTHLAHELMQLPPVGENNFVIELEYNAINATRMNPVLDVLHNKGWKLWGMQPLAYGFLSGKYDTNSRFSAQDWRSLLPGYTVQTLCLLSEAFRNTFLQESALSPAVRAVLFCLMNPILEKIVIGPKHIGQLNDFIQAGKLVNDPEIIRKFEEYTKLIL